MAVVGSSSSARPFRPLVLQGISNTLITGLLTQPAAFGQVSTLLVLVHALGIAAALCLSAFLAGRCGLFSGGSGAARLLPGAAKTSVHEAPVSKSFPLQSVLLNLAVLACAVVAGSRTPELSSTSTSSGSSLLGLLGILLLYLIAYHRIPRLRQLVTEALAGQD